MAVPLPFNLPRGGILSAANDNIPTTNALKKRIEEEMQRRYANRTTISQYTPKAGDQERFNKQESQLLEESQQPLNRAASSKYAANAMKNIIEPGLEAGLLIEGAGLVGKGVNALGKRLAEKQALKRAAMGGADESAIAGYTMKDGKQTLYNINGDELGTIDQSSQIPTDPRLRGKIMPLNQYKPPITGEGAPYLTDENGEKIAENILKPEDTGRDIAGKYLYNHHTYNTNDLSKLIDESKDYIKNNPNDKFIPEIQNKISQLEKGVQKDLKLQEIAKKNNREFFDTGKWNSESYVDAPKKDQLGTVTTSSNLWDMVFKSEGKMKPYTGAETLYFNTGGEGQLARSRMMHPDKQGGAINLIFDKNSLSSEGIVPDKTAGEVTITKDVPLKHLYPEAKLKAKDILLNEADYKGIKLSEKDLMQIDKSLGIKK
jgi:hypothetical protein